MRIGRLGHLDTNGTGMNSYKRDLTQRVNTLVRRGNKTLANHTRVGQVILEDRKGSFYNETRGEFTK